MAKYKSKKLIVFVTLSVLVLILFIIKPYYDLVKDITGISPISILLFEGDYKKTNGQVNFVLLGKAGINHEGPNLTDSILVMSYNIRNKKIAFIPVLRDIWSSTLQDKINSAYAYGEAKKRGGGMILAKSEIGAIVGLPIHYAVVINFDRFKELIDDLGGIEVTVERTFTDDKFPVEGRENDTCDGDPEYPCRYQTLTFTKGRQHMDGTTALNFVRSRNAIGVEGNDFARTNRQQKVINALIARIIAKIKQHNVVEIRRLYDQINTIIERDIKNSELPFIAKKIVLASQVERQQFSLPEAFFTVPNKYDYYGKYVLIPKDNSFDNIHQFVDCMLKKGNESQCDYLNKSK